MKKFLICLLQLKRLDHGLFLAYSLGKGALAGASAVGLGALCYYGSGVKPGTLQEAQ